MRNSTDAAASPLVAGQTPLPILKPCPFCGGDDFHLTYCRVCPLGGPMSPAFYSDITCKHCRVRMYRDATDASGWWNLRAKARRSPRTSKGPAPAAEPTSSKDRP